MLRTVRIVRRRLRHTFFRISGKCRPMGVLFGSGRFLRARPYSLVRQPCTTEPRVDKLQASGLDPEAGGAAILVLWLRQDPAQFLLGAKNQGLGVFAADAEPMRDLVVA